MYRDNSQKIALLQKSTTQIENCNHYMLTFDTVHYNNYYHRISRHRLHGTKLEIRTCSSTVYLLETVVRFLIVVACWHHVHL